MNHGRAAALPALVTLVGLVLACSVGPPHADDGLPATARPVETRVHEATRFPVGTGIDKWDLWTGGTHLRGANVYQRRVYPELDGPDFVGPGPVGPPYTQDDFRRLAALGANYVNISHPGLFTETRPYALDEEILSNLDRLLAIVAQADMFAVISFRTGPGRSEFTFFWDEVDDWFGAEYLDDAIWQDRDAQDAWVAMWRATAERYRDHPTVVGYDLMVEPNANEVGSHALDDPLDVWDPDAFYAEYGGTLYDWNQLYPRIVAAIREVDAGTPILVGGMGYSNVEWLPYLEPAGDPRAVYAVHQYAPHRYTHQWWEEIAVAYPGMLDADWDGEEEPFDRAWLEQLLSRIDDFAAYGAPVAVNEFGVARWVPGAAAFLDDQMDLFEQRGVNHALWVWDPSWEPWVEKVNAFNFRLGPDPQSVTDLASNDLMQVIAGYWARNTVRPSSLVGAPTGKANLAEVTRWLYLIGVEPEPEVVDRIAASDYDMVVLDFVPSESNNTDYPMAGVVARLHEAPRPKLVIAYIDIGEAEDFRTYWQQGWRVGDPEWIAGGDPDGWEGNFPVAFWYDEWQEIWLGEGGILEQILDAGFDGVYLDWIEAYSDENVVAIAEEDRVDPVQEMIWWVEDIGAFVKSRCGECVVVAQNAAELVEVDDYLEAIDAIAQEQVWFDGGADNEPPGDCPLPRTEADVGTEAYRASLSAPCRRYHDSEPDGTLHTSSEWYLTYLTRAHRRGVPIFTVDYALEPGNVAWIYATSRALGFVPFVSSRALDRYVEPVP